MSINKRLALQNIANELGEDYKDLVSTFSDEEVEELFKKDLGDIDVASNLTEEARSEISKKLLQLPSNSGSVLVMPPEDYVKSIKESKDMYDGVAIPTKVTIDPVTGKHSYDLIDINDNKVNKDISISDILEGKDAPIEKYKDSLKSSFGDDISEEDVMEILSFMAKVEKENPKKIYPILPESIKKVIKETFTVVHDPQQFEFAAREFYNMLKLELSMDQQFIELEEAIKKEVQIPDMTDMYLDHIKDVMEVQICNRVNEIEEEYPDKAKLLRELSKTFTDTYTYGTIISKINNKRKIINKELTRELPQYEHYCKKFNAKYKHSKFNITDIRQILYVLDRKLPDDISIDSIKKFIILFCKICKTKTPDSVIDHAYMYYTTRLIEALDHIDSPKTELSKTIIENVSNVIRMIEEC